MTPIKNHPTVIIRNSCLAVMFIAMYLTLNGSLNLSARLLSFLLAAALGIMLAAFAFVWSRTFIEFTDDGVIVEHLILFKRKRVIPYGKIASVNAVRGIADKLFGTAGLYINVNSGVKAKIPNVKFVFERGLAESLRLDLTSRIFCIGEIPAETPDSAISFGARDAVMYGLAGTPTINMLAVAACSIYSILSILLLEWSGTLMALFLLAVNIVPVFTRILKYVDFTVHRSGDRIHLRHGAIRNYATDFSVSKINAVRIRRPLAARLMGMACLEAEVVGINAVENKTTPILCLLMKDEDIGRVMERLIPEFVRDIPTEKQPSRAKFPLLVRASAYSAAILFVVPVFLFGVHGDIETQSGRDLAACVAAIVAATSVSALFIAACIRLRVCRFGNGDGLFSVGNGVIDRETLIIQYDLVQIMSVAAGPLPRRLGLARGTVRLLSSAGSKKIGTGYFPVEDLERTADIMLERVRERRSGGRGGA
jgi:putative membrane protein